MAALVAKKHNTRFAFSGIVFFQVPVALWDSGFVTRLRGSELKRYMTLLRLSNRKYGARTLQFTQEELSEKDGVSSRTAERVHARLQELGLIRINTRTRPHTIELVHPNDWPVLSACFPSRQGKCARAVPDQPLMSLSARDVGFVE